MTQNLLENLERDNWKSVESYAGYIILAKGNDRMLYDPKTNRVDATYKFDK